MQSFTIQGARKMVFGAGAVSTLAEEIGKFGATKVLVVMDQGLSRLDFPDRIMGPLKAGGIEATLFDDLEPEPSPASADAGAALAKKLGVDLVIGVGGGSSMDVAKAVAMLAKNPGSATDYIGLGLVKQSGLPTIMIPTTAGTGSEVTFTAVFTMRESKSKGGINDDKLYPHLALLDPELTLDCPPHVTAYTGMDALTHAIESYTSLNANAVSDIYALEAIRLIGANLREAVFHGNDLEARTNMLLGSYLAGLGLANAGVGAVHALAYPLGAFFGINHGTANAVLLPYVMEFNIPASVDRFSDVAWAMGEPCTELSQRDAAAVSVEAVLALSEDIGIPEGLTDLEIPADAVEEMAAAAMKVARPIANNPRVVLFEDAVEIYRNAY